MERIRGFFQAEIEVDAHTMRLAEPGSLLDEAENRGGASSLSVALLQMGLIGHLPEQFAPGTTRRPQLGA